MHKHMMTCHVYAMISTFSLSIKIKWRAKSLVQLFGSNPIFNLMISVLLEVHHSSCDQLCMMMKILGDPYFSERFGITNTFFGGPDQKLLIL